MDGIKNKNKISWRWTLLQKASFSVISWKILRILSGLVTSLQNESSEFLFQVWHISLKQSVYYQEEIQSFFCWRSNDRLPLKSWSPPVDSVAFFLVFSGNSPCFSPSLCRTLEWSFTLNQIILMHFDRSTETRKRGKSRSNDPHQRYFSILVCLRTHHVLKGKRIEFWFPLRSVVPSCSDQHRSGS